MKLIVEYNFGNSRLNEGYFTANRGIKWDFYEVQRKVFLVKVN